MISFNNDYSEGCNPKILEALTKTNLESTVGYGEDEYTNKAINRIKELVNDQNVFVHLMVGGTITNLTVISGLRPYEAVISCDTGHINVHETGAIEATGHKVIAVKNELAKLTPELISEVMFNHTDYHMVKPKMVYISNSTEYGTIYTKAELIKLREVCDQYGLYLYMDGARIASALTSKGNDLDLATINKLCDAFYLGGTKNGLLFGEALVIRNEEMQPDFKFLVKQHGGLLAKGRLLGVQFYEALKDDLFFEMGKHANEMANLIRDNLKSLGIKEYMPSVTNQIFIEVSNALALAIHNEVICDDFISFKDTRVIRFVTSFATKLEDVLELNKIMHKFFRK